MASKSQSRAPEQLTPKRSSAAPARPRKAVPARGVAPEPKAPPRPESKGPTKPAIAPAKAIKKVVKPRPVLVRDSFTMPEADFALIAQLKATALGGQRAAKKSELLRAGLQLLGALDAASLVGALNRLDTVKTGRPKKGH